MVIWITGLSGAGKTTLAKEIVAKMRLKGDEVVLLDGDELREIFVLDNFQSTNHSREMRLALAMRYAKLCRLLSIQGLTVVIATISMFKEVHKWNRENLPNYKEIYLKVPMDELRRRDPKGIYEKYDAGEVKNVAGLDLVVDEPETPDILIDYSYNFETDIRKIAEKILKMIYESE